MLLEKQNMLSWPRKTPIKRRFDVYEIVLKKSQLRLDDATNNYSCPSAVYDILGEINKYLPMFKIGRAGGFSSLSYESM